MTGMALKRLWVVALVALVAGALTAPGTATAEPAAEPLPGQLASENVEFLDVVPRTTGAVGAHFKDDVMYLTTTTGLQTFDISVPETPARLGTLPLPHFENEDVSLGGDILLISNDAAESTGILYVIDISGPAAPAILSTFQMGGNPVEGGPGHTASCILQCKYAWVTDAAGIKVIDLTDPAAPVDNGTFETDAGGAIAAHDVQVDGNGLAWVVGFGGAVAYKIPKGYDGTSLGVEVARTNEEGFSTYLEQLGLGTGDEPNDYILHNSRRLTNGKVVYITEEDYTRPGCEGAGAFETWNLPTKKVTKNGTVRRVPTGDDLTPIDQWVTESLANPEEWDAAPPAAALCSAHYFDIKRGVVAQGWYEQGLRLLDVSDPGDIRQIGYFVLPTGIVWASHFAPTDPSGRIIYNLDYTGGLQVLRFDRPAKGKTGMEPCTGKNKNKCEKRHQAPAQVAPVLDEWRTGFPLQPPLPAGGTAGGESWGYACRIIGAPIPEPPLP